MKKLLKIIPLLWLIGGSVVLGGTRTLNASNYSYCRTLTALAGGTSGGVATTTTLQFPLFASSTLSTLAATSSSGRVQLVSTSTAGVFTDTPIDITFVDEASCSFNSSLTAIPYYFEKYASTTGAFAVHLGTSNISSTTQKVITMYYGNANAIDLNSPGQTYATTSPDTPAGVWDLSVPGYATTTYPDFTDSTYNNNPASSKNIASTTSTTGYLDGGLSFDGVNDYVIVSNIQYIQSKDARVGAVDATTIPVTFTNTTVSGNTIVGAVTWGRGGLGVCDNTSLTSVTDNKGNSYTKKGVASDTTNGQWIQAFYAKNITGGASHIVTANFGASCDFRAIAVHEVSGVDTTAPDDGSNQQLQTAPGTGADGLSSGLFTTTSSGDYIFGMTMDSGSNAAAHTTGTLLPFTRVTNGSSADVDAASEWAIQPSAGSVAGTWKSSTNVAHVTSAIALKPASIISAVNTVSFWMKVATSTTQNIIDLNGFATITDNSGTINANNFTSPTIYVDGVVSSTVNNTAWHHVAITSDTATSTGAISIGRVGNKVFGGQLDDVRIYNRALNAMDVLTLYNNTCCSARFWTFGAEQTPTVAGTGNIPRAILRGLMRIINGRVIIR